MRLQVDGNVLESLNTHHSFGMKYVDPNLIIYIIKSAQQFLSTEPQSRSTGRSHNDAQQPRHLFGSFVISTQRYSNAYKLHILSVASFVSECQRGLELRYFYTSIKLLPVNWNRKQLQLI